MGGIGMLELLIIGAICAGSALSVLAVVFVVVMAARKKSP